MGKNMQKIKVNLGMNSYFIHIGFGILDQLSSTLQTYYNRESKCAIITNPIIDKLYGNRLKDRLEIANFSVITIEIPDGENYKTLDTASFLYDELINNSFDRQSFIVALGGGVVGDLAGFVAATYLRGVPLIQVPTSLIAQVDSSVGGKVGVNHPLGKNMIGAFYQPQLVWIDSATLRTLNSREITSGLAEIIKYGMIMDEEFFAFLEKNLSKIMQLDKDVLDEVITKSCEIKAKIVEKDEKEQGLRAILNYGHTCGHAFESLSGYTVYKHGEAISIGMACAADLSYRLGILNKDDLIRQNNLLKMAGLPTTINGLDVPKIIERLYLDKKVKNGKIRFILPESIGKVFIADEVPIDTLQEVLEYYTK